MSFKNMILGGVNLLRAAIRSPNYVTGVSGWTINQDGSAEFNNVVIRGGTIVSGTALYYSGTPAAGNLIMSIAATAGTDAFGNAYLAGIGAYGTADRITAKSSSGDTVALRADAVSYVSDATAPGIQFRQSTETGDGASITEYDDTFDRGLLALSPSPVTGGSGGDDFAYLQMIGKFSADPSISMFATGPASYIGLNATTFDKDGIVTGYGGGAFNTYVPAVSGGGTVTWSTRTGWWQRMGPWVFFTAYLVVNAAGSGAANVTIDAPVNLDRTTRQAALASCEGLTAGNNGSCSVTAFTGGAGATFDRLRNSGGTNITGAALAAGALIIVQGIVREA